MPGVSDLPTEIIIEIIGIAILVPPDAIRYVAYDSDYRQDTVLLVRLSHVCHLWRTIILETPFLWSFASTKYKSAITRSIIRRSRGFPLSVELDFFSRRITSAEELFEQQDRIRSLKIALTFFETDESRTVVHKFLGKPAPLLEAVSIFASSTTSLDVGHTTPLFLGQHPRLCSITLSHVAPLWDSSIFIGLTRLVVHQVPRIKQPTIEELLSILDKCPNLVDLELKDAGPRDLCNNRRRKQVPLHCLLSLSLYTPQATTCADFLTLLNLPKLVRLSIGHDEPLLHDVDQLIPLHLHPTQPLGMAEIAFNPALSYLQIVFRIGPTSQHQESFRFHYFHKHTEDFGVACNFVSSALLTWDKSHALPMTIKIRLDPFRSLDMPSALGAFFSTFPNIVSIVFSTSARYGYDGDTWDAFYIFEETVKHGQLTVPLLAELTFQKMRFADKLDNLHHILQFRGKNGAILPHLTFKSCSGVRRSQLRQLCDEKVICDFSVFQQ